MTVGQEVSYKVFKGTEEVYKRAKITQVLEGLGIYVMVMDGKSWMNGKEFLVTTDKITTLISNK